MTEKPMTDMTEESVGQKNARHYIVEQKRKMDMTMQHMSAENTTVTDKTMMNKPRLRNRITNQEAGLCRNCGGLGWLGVTQGHRQCRRSIEHVIDFSRNYVSVLYCFRVIATSLLKVADLNIHHLHLALSLE